MEIIDVKNMTLIFLTNKTLSPTMCANPSSVTKLNHV